MALGNMKFIFSLMYDDEIALKKLKIGSFERKQVIKKEKGKKEIQLSKNVLGRLARNKFLAFLKKRIKKNTRCFPATDSCNKNIIFLGLIDLRTISHVILILSKPDGENNILSMIQTDKI